jgi:hypothetical protein
VIGLALSGSSPSLALGQVRTGSIIGTITDATGGALPGVTVTVSGPALQGPHVAGVSNAQGEYQAVELPPGIFAVRYELAGFQTLVREEIRLTAGFTARVDVSLRVASLEESITVSGQSPLVDVANTRGGGTVTRDVLEGLPTSRNYYDTMLLVPGAQIQGPPQTAEVGFRAVVAGHKTYGQSGNTSNSLDGIEMLSNEAPDFSSVDEVDVKTYGNTAEAGASGAVIQLIVQSGGNKFHGRYTEQVIHRRLSSNNVDDALRQQGINDGDRMNYHYDFTGDLGGFIVRDKLWFYGALRDERNERTAVGYIHERGPDNLHGTADDVAGFLPGRNKNKTIKVTYAYTPNHKLIGLFARNPFEEDYALADRFRASDGTVKLNQTGAHGKFEYQGTFGEKLFFSTLVGSGGYTAQYWLVDSAIGVPNRWNRNTNINTGAMWDRSTFARTRRRHQISGNLSWFPERSLAGNHSIQAGYRAWPGTRRLVAPSPESASGDPIGDPLATTYRLVYDVVGGVPNRPVELWVKNYPYDGKEHVNEFAVFVADTWRPSRRATVNLGLRWERTTTSIPEQTKPQGPFGNAGTFPKIATGSWTALAPRVGVAYDLSGDGKTVLKGSYSLYNTQWPDSFAGDYNTNQEIQYRYRWSDPNGNNDYDPGEVNLNVNSADFIQLTGSSNNLLNPDLQWPRTHELSASFERELPGQMSVRGLYVYKREVDNYANTNILRPYDVWNRSFTRRDPGPDGLLNTGDDAGLVTIYDYDPAFRGAAFQQNMRVNSDLSNTYGNYEVTLTRRKSGRWYAFTSFLATKNHRYLTLVPQGPNDELFNLDDTWELSYRASGGYDFPYGINASLLYAAYNGLPGQRTYVFRAADPSGGPAFPSSTTLTIRTEPFGDRKGPARHVLNIRSSRQFNLGGTKRLSVNVDVLNLINANTPWGSASGSGPGITWASGPTFGYAIRIMNPRLARFGVAFAF